MFNLTVVTNTRPPKDERPVVSTTSTTGNFKLSPAAAALLGVTAEDYISIGSDGAEGMFIFKGKKGGEESGNVGAKLAFQGEQNAGSLNFSSANAWNLAKGTNEDVLKYILDVDNVASVENDESVGTYAVSLGLPAETKFYPLTFDSSTPKSARTSKGDGEEGGEQEGEETIKPKGKGGRKKAETAE